jgi:hypothetical protein
MARQSPCEDSASSLDADPKSAPVPFELEGIFRGDNSEAAFVDMVRKYVVSGVSGVVPKFLTPNTLGDHQKGTLATEQYIIATLKTSRCFMRAARTCAWRRCTAC